MKVFIVAAAACVTLVSSSALAQSSPVIDGNIDASYGAAKSRVNYSPVAPESNFDAPTALTDAIGYDIYLTSDANNVYGLLKTSGPGSSIGSFANLYFDIDPQNNNGSDIGFEITNKRGFVAGGASGGYAPLAINYFSNATTLEFSIPNSAFSSSLPGLASDYEAGQQFATIGSNVVLRLSQSFGYSVAGGASYGANRLGAVTLGGSAIASPTPEPATWAMMILGFGLAGVGLRRRQRVTTRVSYAI